MLGCAFAATTGGGPHAGTLLCATADVPDTTNHNQRANTTQQTGTHRTSRKESQQHITTRPCSARGPIWRILEAHDGQAPSFQRPRRHLRARARRLRSVARRTHLCHRRNGVLRPLAARISAAREPASRCGHRGPPFLPATPRPSAKSRRTLRRAIPRSRCSKATSRTSPFPPNRISHIIHAATDTVATGERSGAGRLHRRRDTAGFLPSAQSTGARRLLYTSSGAVYGPWHYPTSPASPKPTPVRPPTLTPTTDAKRIAEQLCIDAPIDTTIARCFAFVGPLPSARPALRYRQLHP